MKSNARAILLANFKFVISSLIRKSVPRRKIARHKPLTMVVLSAFLFSTFAPLAVNAQSTDSAATGGTSAAAVTGDTAATPDPVAYRRLKAHSSKGDNKIFTSDFSIVSALAAVLPLRQMRASDAPEDRDAIERILKDGAILLKVTAGGAAILMLLLPIQSFLGQPI